MKILLAALMVFIFTLVSCGGTNNQTVSESPRQIPQEPTAPPPDQPPPSTDIVIKSHLPASWQVGVVLMPRIIAEFDDWRDDYGNLSVYLSPPVEGDLLINPTKKQIEYRLRRDLMPFSKYQVSIVAPVSSNITNSAQENVAVWEFTTMGGLAVRRTTPADGEVATLDTPISVEYSDSTTTLSEVRTMLTLEGVGGNLSATFPLASWQPEGLLPEGREFTAKAETRYVDEAGDVRMQGHEWKFKTPDLWSDTVSETPVGGAHNIGYKIVVGPRSGDIYVIGKETLDDPARPVLWFGRYSSSGEKKWERMISIASDSDYSIPNSIALDSSEENIYIACSMYVSVRGYDQYLFKYTTDGDYRWKASNDTPVLSFSRDLAYDVAVDGSLAYLVGSSPRPDHDGNPANDNTYTQITIRAYNIEDGSLVWATSPPSREALGGRVDTATSVAAQGGSIFAAGIVTDGAGRRELWLAKIDPENGDIIAESSFYKADLVAKLDMKLFADSVYVTGSSSRQIFWGKYSEAGAAFVENSYYHYASARIGNGIDVANVNGDIIIYIAGDRYQSCTRGTTPITKVTTWIGRYREEDGVLLMPEPDTDIPICANSSANDISASSGGFVATGYVPQSPFSSDVGDFTDRWIRKFNNSAAIAWTKVFNSSTAKNLSLSPLGKTPEADIVVAGNYGSRPSSAFIQKYSSSDGRPIWPSAYYYSGKDQLFNDVTVGSDGSIYACGGLNIGTSACDLLVSKLDSAGTDELLLENYPFTADRTSRGGACDSCSSIAVEDDGHMFVGGQFVAPAWAYRSPAIARLCPDGRSDMACGAWKTVWDWVPPDESGHKGAGYIQKIFPCPGGKLFAYESYLNYTSSRYFMIFYLLRQADGKDYRSGADVPVPLAVIETEGTSYRKIAMNDKEEIFFAYDAPGEHKTTLAKLNLDGGTVTTIKKYDPIPQLSIDAIDESGKIFGHSFLFDLQTLASSSNIMLGTLRETRLFVALPDGTEVTAPANRPLLTGTIRSSLSGLLLLPDSTIIGGRNYTDGEGVSGFLRRCDLIGNCVGN